MIELQYFEDADFGQLIGWICNPELLLQWTGPVFTFPLDEIQLKKYVEDANRSGSSTLAYKAIQPETGQTVGHISLGQIDYRHRTARVGRVLIGESALRGRGLGRYMMEEALKIAFDDLGLHRVGLGVYDFNRSAIACYERAGFVKEGLLRDISYSGTAYWSLWEMSMLEQEWLNKKNKQV